MSVLIQFEDRNGLPDVFISKYKMKLIGGLYVNEDGSIIVKKGCGMPNILTSDNKVIRSLDVLKYYPEYVVKVFDMDNEEGDSDLILSPEFVHGVLFRNIKKDTKNILFSGIDIPTYYVPVVYCMESIMLYSIIREKALVYLNTEEITNRENINEYLSRLVRLAFGVSNGKVFQNFVDFDRLKENLSKRRDTGFRNVVIDWILSDFEIDKKYLLNSTDFYEEVLLVRDYFNTVRQENFSLLLYESDKLKYTVPVQDLAYIGELLKQSRKK
jgi:hypothetical protein